MISAKREQGLHERWQGEKGAYVCSNGGILGPAAWKSGSQKEEGVQGRFPGVREAGNETIGRRKDIGLLSRHHA